MSLKITITSLAEGASNPPKIFDGKKPIRIGRLEDNDVVLGGPESRVVSGRHAEIRIDRTSVYIVDTQSANGTYVDGNKVEAMTLGPSSRVQLGENGPALRVEIDFGQSAPGADTMVVPAKTPSRKYGERTVGMLIRQALEQAGLLKPRGTSKSTDYFEHLVEERVNRTSARLKWIVAVAVLFLIAGGVGLGVYFYRNRSVQYIQQTQVAYGEAVGAQVAAQNRYSIFLLAGVSAETNAYQGFCTAFAISTDVLATNAHCVNLVLTKFQNPVAFMNGMPSTSYPIVRAVAHPGFVNGRLSTDVGLLRVTGQFPYAVTLATPDELAQISAGMTVFLYGFPGRLSQVSEPEATFVTGQIGRVTGLDQVPHEFSDNVLIQHSAFTSSGTSGSPLFNSSGHVIGINAGGYTENGKTLIGYNFGMRVDLIYSLIQSI